MQGYLEGTLRNTGIHACGVIITPDDIKKFVPIAELKIQTFMLLNLIMQLLNKQDYLKMDFLGLKNINYN